MHSVLVYPNLPKTQITAGIREHIEKLKGIGAKAKKQLAHEYEHYVSTISENVGTSKKAVIKCLEEPSCANALKACNYSFATMYGAYQLVDKAANDGVLHVLGYLAKGNVFHKMQHKLHGKGKKMDEILNKHPCIKKLTGPAIAGLMLYGWNHCDTNSAKDWDMSKIAKAFKGDFSVEDFIQSSECVYLAKSAASGKLINPAHLAASATNMLLGVVSTVAHRIDDKDVAKLKDALKSAAPKITLAGIAKAKSFVGNAKSMGVSLVRKGADNVKKTKDSIKKSGSNWFDSMSKEKQDDYIEENPNSVYAT